ncbi:HTTM domain-containing protein [Candidatus Nomurabacteria bacterium]|nr:HTTM domain-containing protein [Candidatus Nomurabacteria bacterium]
MKRFIRYFKRSFSLDLRSFAITRFLLGILLLFDFGTRLTLLSEHYGSQSTLPLTLLRSTRGLSHQFSVFFQNDSQNFILLLFGIGIVITFLFTIGFKTRLMNILLWIFIVSLHNRNPLVLQGGDTVIRMMLFWGIFLPLGEIWSFDWYLKRRKAPIESTLGSYAYFSVGSVAFILQLIFIYLFTALLKSGNQWYPDGTAIYYALEIDQFLKPFGSLLLHVKTLLKPLTLFVWGLELFGWAFYFSPVWRPNLKTITVTAFILLHIGIGFSMAIGLFPWLMCVYWIALLPASVWKPLDRYIYRIEERLFKSAKPPKQKKNFNKLKSVWAIIDPLRTASYSIFLLIVLIVVLLWNINSVNPNLVIPEPISKAVEYVRIDQVWDMFAPYPLVNDGWYVVVGTYADGSKKDLFQHNDNVDWNKPKWVYKTYRNQRERKYMMNLVANYNAVYRRGYADYLCKHSPDSGKLNKVEMYFMQEYTLPDYAVPSANTVLLVSQTCLH